MQTYSKQTLTKFKPRFQASNRIQNVYLEGNLKLLQNTKTVWFTGANNPSQNAIYNTKQYANAALQHQVTIITNLEAGIDHWAQLQALYQQRPTIAWLASNLDQCYPIDHDYLKSLTLIDHGLLITDHQTPFVEDLTRTQRDADLVALADQIIFPEFDWTPRNRMIAKLAAQLKTPVAFVEQKDPKINKFLLNLGFKQL